MSTMRADTIAEAVGPGRRVLIGTGEVAVAQGATFTRPAGCGIDSGPSRGPGHGGVSSVLCSTPKIAEVRFGWRW